MELNLSGEISMPLLFISSRVIALQHLQTMCLSCMINNIDFRVAPTCLKKDTSIILDRHASQLVKTI